MDDPTRIDPTLESLRRAWEGQPDLSLATFFAMLANRGIGWGASDAELVAELQRQAAVHPPLLPLDNGRIAESWEHTLMAVSISPRCGMASSVRRKAKVNDR